MSPHHRHDRHDLHNRSILINEKAFTMSASEDQLQPQQPERICRFCQNLQPSNRGIRNEIDFDEWILGITASSCLRCQLLVQAMQMLEPEFLAGVGAHPDEKVWLSVSEGCRVIIGLSTNGRGRRVVDIQLYSTNGRLSMEFPILPGDTESGDILGNNTLLY